MHRKLLSLILLTLFIAFGVRGQTSQTEEKQEDTNLETQLYIILATNHDVSESRIPSSLDAIVKQARATLPFKNYQLATTLLNRVKNNGGLNLRWVSAPITSFNDAAQPVTKIALQLQQVTVQPNSEGQSIVRISFSFDAAIPISVSANRSPPVFFVENVTLGTVISMREGEPVIIGSLNVGPSGDTIILVLSAKRTS